MVKIRLFGRCALESDATVIQDINCAKARELLGYLACRRDRHLSREAVIGALWGDMQEEQGKRALRQTLWQVQSALTPFQITASNPLIETDSEWIRLNLNSGIWLDVARFEELEMSTRLVSGELPTPAHTSKLKEAIALYRGPLMEDCFKDWCILQRDLLRHQYLRMLQRLMRCQRKSADFDGAMATALTLLREEPASENAHLTVMWLYHREGDRTSALRQFEQYKRILREELNAPPTKVVVDLNNKIRDDVGQKKEDWTDVETARIESFVDKVLSLLEQIRNEMSQNRQDIEEVKDSIDKKNSDEQKK